MDMFLFTVQMKGSSMCINSMGESGQPSLVPLCICTGSEREPLIFNLAVRFWYKEEIQVSMLVLKPICVHTESMKSQATLSVKGLLRICG